MHTVRTMSDADYAAAYIGFDRSTIAHQLSEHGHTDLAMNVSFADDHEEAAWFIGRDWDRYRIGETDWADPYIGRHIRSFVTTFEGWDPRPAVPRDIL